MLRKLLFMAYGLLGYLCATFSLVILVVFLGNWMPGIAIDQGIMRPPAQALAINLSLLALWSVQHIGMARSGFKAWILRWLPAPLERSTYVLATAAVLLLVVTQWSPMPATVWAVENPLARQLVTALFFFGWLYAIAGILYDSYFEFHGLEQPYRYFRGQDFTVSTFKTGFLFRLSRRPTFFGILIGCWATPHLTQGHLLFAIAMTFFTLVGAWFVERTYLRNYGEDYRQVQRHKPLIVPDPRLLLKKNRPDCGDANGKDRA